MAIVDEAGQHEPLTTGERALNLFTDRFSLIRHFAERLNEDPVTNKILFYDGDGGNGKSLLLRYLARYHCQRLEPDNWSYVSSKPDAEFVDEFKIAEGGTPVPAAFLDFRFHAPTDAVKALRKLRSDLGEHGIHFPLFDFACFWHLKKTRQLTDEQLTNLFADEELDWIAAVTELVVQHPAITVVKATLAVVHKRITERRVDERFTQYLRRRNLNQNDLGAIMAMDPERELIDKLPELFARDLNAAIALQDWPKRVVLFFDGHEAFWGAQRNRRNATYFQQDAWLRCLLSHLELSVGIIAVVAGREFPYWSEADQFQIQERFIDLKHVEELSDTDAHSYLERALAGIEVTSDLYAFLCDYARVGIDRVHPLYLAMCAEIALAAAKEVQAAVFPDEVRLDPNAGNKAQALISRFLSYEDEDIAYAVPVLSACRSFDWELYLALGEALHMQPSRAVFDNLIEFSFVRKEVGTELSNKPVADIMADPSRVSEDVGSQNPRYRIHDLLRRVFFERTDDLVRKADEALEQYYVNRADGGEQTAIAEAIYHTNRLNWERGARIWLAVFDWALRQSNYEICRVLLDIKTELILDTDYLRAVVSQTEGAYLMVIAHYDAAKQAFSDAIATYDQVLQYAPDHVHALNNKGNTLQSLGSLQVQFAQYQSAQRSYTNAITAFEQALHHAPNHVEILNNKGTTLANLGDLQDMLADYLGALQSYTEAISAIDQVLQHAPEHLYVLNNKGTALRDLGNLQIRLADYAGAWQSYTDAISVYAQVLQRAPDYVLALSNKGNTLLRLGDLQVQLTQYRSAQQTYTDAIAAFDQALLHAPYDVSALVNKGTALIHLGDWLANLAEPSAAQQTYTDAIVVFDQVLQYAPDHMYALNNKGSALAMRGDLQTKLADYPAAWQSYADAIAVIDRAMQGTPDHVWALNHMGRVLIKCGELQQKALSDCEGAKESFERAIASFSRSLEIAPDDTSIRNSRDHLKTVLDTLDC